MFARKAISQFSKSLNQNQRRMVTSSKQPPLQQSNAIFIFGVLGAVIAFNIVWTFREEVLDDWKHKPVKQEDSKK